MSDSTINNRFYPFFYPLVGGNNPGYTGVRITASDGFTGANLVNAFDDKYTRGTTRVVSGEVGGIGYVHFGGNVHWEYLRLELWKPIAAKYVNISGHISPGVSTIDDPPNSDADLTMRYLQTHPTRSVDDYRTFLDVNQVLTEVYGNYGTVGKKYNAHWYGYKQIIVYGANTDVSVDATTITDDETVPDIPGLKYIVRADNGVNENEIHQALQTDKYKYYYILIQCSKLVVQNKFTQSVQDEGYFAPAVITNIQFLTDEPPSPWLDVDYGVGYHSAGTRTSDPFLEHEVDHNVFSTTEATLPEWGLHLTGNSSSVEHPVTPFVVSRQVGANDPWKAFRRDIFGEKRGGMSVTPSCSPYGGISIAYPQSQAINHFSFFVRASDHEKLKGYILYGVRDNGQVVGLYYVANVRLQNYPAQGAHPECRYDFSEIDLDGNQYKWYKISHDIGTVFFKEYRLALLGTGSIVVPNVFLKNRTQIPDGQIIGEYWDQLRVEYKNGQVKIYAHLNVLSTNGGRNIISFIFNDDGHVCVGHLNASEANPIRAYNVIGSGTGTLLQQDEHNYIGILSFDPVSEHLVVEYSVEHSESNTQLKGRLTLSRKLVLNDGTIVWDTNADHEGCDASYYFPLGNRVLHGTRVDAAAVPELPSTEWEYKQTVKSIWIKNNDNGKKNLIWRDGVLLDDTYKHASYTPQSGATPSRITLAMENWSDNRHYVVGIDTDACKYGLIGRRQHLPNAVVDWRFPLSEVCGFSGEQYDLTPVQSQECSEGGGVPYDQDTGNISYVENYWAILNGEIVARWSKVSPTHSIYDISVSGNDWLTLLPSNPDDITRAGYRQIKLVQRSWTRCPINVCIEFDKEKMNTANKRLTIGDPFWVMPRVKFKRVRHWNVVKIRAEFLVTYNLPDGCQSTGQFVQSTALSSDFVNVDYGEYNQTHDYLRADGDEVVVGIESQIPVLECHYASVQASFTLWNSKGERIDIDGNVLSDQSDFSGQTGSVCYPEKDCSGNKEETTIGTGEKEPPKQDWDVTDPDSPRPIQLPHCGEDDLFQYNRCPERGSLYIDGLPYSWWVETYGGVPLWFAGIKKLHFELFNKYGEFVREWWEEIHVDCQKIASASEVFVLTDGADAGESALFDVDDDIFSLSEFATVTKKTIIDEIYTLVVTTHADGNREYEYADDAYMLLPSQVANKPMFRNIRPCRYGYDGERKYYVMRETIGLDFPLSDDKKHKPNMNKIKDDGVFGSLMMEYPKFFFKFTTRNMDDTRELHPVAISAGQAHTAWVMNDGSLWTAGDNTFFQLGRETGAETPQYESNLGKVAVPNNEKVKMVSCGLLHTAIVTESGKLYTFGDNGYGQLLTGGGSDSSLRLVNPPSGIVGFFVSQVECGAYSTQVIYSRQGADGDTERRLANGGRDFNGELGRGVAGGITPFADVTLMIDGQIWCPDKISSQVYHTVIAAHSKTDRLEQKILTFGTNGYGQLLRETAGQHDPNPAAMTVDLPYSVIDVKAGYGTTALLCENGDLYIAGANYTGQTGRVGASGSNTASNIDLTASGVRRVSVGYDHAAWIDNDGFIWTCGDNQHGELLEDKWFGSETVSNLTKTQYRGDRVYCGENFTCFITPMGHCYTAGDNQNGKIARNTPNSTVDISNSIVHSNVGEVPRTNIVIGTKQVMRMSLAYKQVDPTWSTFHMWNGRPVEYLYVGMFPSTVQSTPKKLVFSLYAKDNPDTPDVNEGFASETADDILAYIKQTSRKFDALSYDHVTMLRMLAMMTSKGGQNINPFFGLEQGDPPVSPVFLDGIQFRKVYDNIADRMFYMWLKDTYNRPVMNPSDAALTGYLQMPVTLAGMSKKQNTLKYYADNTLKLFPLTFTDITTESSIQLTPATDGAAAPHDTGIVQSTLVDGYHISQIARSKKNKFYFVAYGDISGSQLQIESRYDVEQPYAVIRQE